MYSVLIVDDEPVLRMGLSKMISWEERGFQIVGSVMNGRSALVFLEENQVDLVITDMKMPVMDGLELVYTLQKEGFQGACVVLTNYSDFDLARESFRGGAVDYILKATLTPEELKECLKKVKEKLNNRNVKKNGVQKEREDTDEKNISDWLNREPGSVTVLSAPFCGLCFFQTGAYHENFKEHAENLLQNTILLNKNLIFKEEEQRLYCYYRKEDSKGRPPHTLSERLISLMKTYHNRTVFSIVGKNLDTMEAFVQFGEESRRGEEFLFYSGFKNVFYAEECKLYQNGLRIKSRDLGDNYQKNIRSGSFDRAKEDLIWGFASILEKNPNPSLAKEWIEAIINMILIENRIYFDESREEFEEITSSFQKSNTYGDYVTLISFITHQLEQVLIKFQKDQYREEITAIMEYVENHLSSRISLGDISKVVNMNESYISRLFKQETSMVLMGYINMLKIERAMELLKDPDLKVKDIVDLVGVEQQSYFNKIFNKYCGINPLDYKKTYKFIQSGTGKNQ